MSAESPSAAAPERPSLACPVSVVVLALAGAIAAANVHGASPPPPAGTGLDRIGSPEIVLAAFDTLWVLLLLPGRKFEHRFTLLAVGLPFHIALAAAATTGVGHPLALMTVLGAYTVVLSVDLPPRARFPGLGLALVAFAAPLVGYALLEMAVIESDVLLRCSPLTAPTLLVRAPEVDWPDGAPAIAGAAVVLLLDQVLGRMPRREP